MSWAWLVGGIGIAGLLYFVVQWIKGAMDNAVSLDERNAALQVEQSHVDALEKANAVARAARAKELDEAKSKVRTPDDAAALLRGELPVSRADGPKADPKV